MRRWRIVAVLAIAAAGACGRGPGGPDEQLEFHLGQSLARPAGTRVDLTEVADFPWDTVHVFPPYATADAVERTLGFAWDGAARIADRDDIALIVFVHEGTVARFVELPRSLADLATGDGAWALPRARAIVEVRADPSDARRTLIVPAG